MFNQKGVALPQHLVAALEAYLQKAGDTRALDDVVAIAVRAWLDRQGEVLRGYQWKSLFLPEGTQLRLRFRERTYVAQVRGEAIIFGGRTWSPRQWVIAVMGSVRNAWREIWLRCPGDAFWHLADSRRRLLRRHPAAKPAPPAPQPPKPQASTAPAFYHEMIHLDALFWLHPRAAPPAPLRRDDMLREDQPDLRPCQGVWPRRYPPGRPGLPDRRQAPLPGLLGRRALGAPPMRYCASP